MNGQHKIMKAYTERMTEHGQKSHLMNSSRTKCFINGKKMVSLYGTGGNLLLLLIEDKF